MDHPTIEKKNIVERYLADQLGQDEAAAFETHYLHCGACQDQVEADMRLRSGVKRVAAEDTALATDLVRAGWLAWYLRLGSGVRAALAATFLALFLVPLGLLGIRLGHLGTKLDDRTRDLDRERQQIAQLHDQIEKMLLPQTNTPRLPIGPERSIPLAGEEPTHQVQLPPEPRWLIFSLELDETTHAQYEVALFQAGQRLIWQAQGLEPDHYDALTIMLHSSFLEAGDYQFRVTTPGSGITSFTFRAHDGPAGVVPP